MPPSSTPEYDSLSLYKVFFFPLTTLGPTNAKVTLTWILNLHTAPKSNDQSQANPKPNTVEQNKSTSKKFTYQLESLNRTLVLDYLVY